MINFFHKLFNPHCPHCKADEEDNKVCTSCEVLKLQLNIVNAEKERLLEALLEKPKPDLEPRKLSQDELERVKPKMMTWNMRRQMLEAEDRETAKLMRKREESLANLKRKPTDELEKELGVTNAETIGRNDGEAVQSIKDESDKEETSSSYEATNG
jgi:hypothetical protein